MRLHSNQSYIWGQGRTRGSNKKLIRHCRSGKRVLNKQGSVLCCSVVVFYCWCLFAFHLITYLGYYNTIACVHSSVFSRGNCQTQVKCTFLVCSVYVATEMETAQLPITAHTLEKNHACLLMGITCNQWAAYSAKQKVLKCNHNLNTLLNVELLVTF